MKDRYEFDIVARGKLEEKHAKAKKARKDIYIVFFILRIYFCMMIKV